MENETGRRLVTISANHDEPTILVGRSETVPATFWGQVHSSWGMAGPHPSRSVVVDRDRFLSRLNWLADACKSHRVHLEWNTLAQELVREVGRIRSLIEEAREHPKARADLSLLAAPESRFIAELRSFQDRDLGRLAELAHGANFSVPGAGKTAVTLGLYELERLRGRVDGLLVVCPMSAFDSWLRESATWLAPRPTIRIFDGSGFGNEEILLVNYQRLDPGSYQNLVEWVTARNCHVVLDEAHRIKRGWSGQWGRQALLLAHLATRRDVLTGTPAPQHPRDLLALVDFCWPDQARRVLPGESLQGDPTEESVERAGRAIRPLFVRTTKSELGLAEPIKEVVSVPMGPLHEQIYRALAAQYAGSYSLSQHDRVSMVQMGRIVMYLLEAATNPLLLPAGSAPGDPLTYRHPPLEIPPESDLAVLLADYGQFETPYKFIELAQIVERNANVGRKTLIWSNFVRNLDYLAHRLLAAFEPALIHGGVPFSSPDDDIRDRVTELKRFREDSDCAVLLANPAAMGEGISLHQVCHDAVYVERTFNAGQFLQSVDRIHRLGLPPDQETNITFLISPGTIDDVVVNRVEEKATRLSILMDDPALIRMALPDGDDYREPLDAGQDVYELLRHLQEVRGK